MASQTFRFTSCRLLVAAAWAVALVGCSTFDEPVARPAFQAQDCCGGRLTQVPSLGLLRPGQMAELGEASNWWADDTGLAPVASWELPFPRSEARLELVVALPDSWQTRRSPLPLLKVRFLDDLGLVLDTPLVGPRAEQASAPQVRWWVDVPAAARQVVLNVDASQAGRMFNLEIAEEGPTTVVAGIRLQGASVVTPVPVRASLGGRIRLLLQGV